MNRVAAEAVNRHIGHLDDAARILEVLECKVEQPSL
jgi:hypothetical protein